MLDLVDVLGVDLGKVITQSNFDQFDSLRNILIGGKRRQTKAEKKQDRFLAKVERAYYDEFDGDEADGDIIDIRV